MAHTPAKVQCNHWHIAEQIKSDMPLNLLTILIRVAIETGVTVHLGVIYESPQVTNKRRGGVRELPALRRTPTYRQKPVVFHTYRHKSR
jgi:hypothetical protein